jgi:hypothetical protein
MTNWRIWIENGPRISPLEIALLAAAVLFLYVVPVVLSWSDAWRRRRIRRQEMMASWIAAPEVSPLPVPSADGLAAPAVEGTAFDAIASEMLEHAVEIPAAEPHAPIATWPAATAALAAEIADAPEPIFPPEPEVRMEEPLIVPGMVAVSDSNRAMPTERPPLEVQPLEGVARHQFRLRELHRAGLPDWPPSAIRDDAERRRTWSEAERIIEAHWEQLSAIVIASPYPARSACLGAAETHAGRYRIHFLLFPVLWPMAEGQAVAQAVFEVDAAGGPIRGWVDALRASELSADHRREIIANGGEP